ncbi:Polyketide cyclase / dehydrase and lipid transport [Microlunatus sagamiharensis]|uniref:Polyketide cyclase / dehydrase and lipid transport n=1 Tax=Microlunatus sagamiharensis TaxID=546874 RepID=A0A1H2MRB1_9ACTN|nr:SRPBCC family protein [Microlunatus sagamiharensis]SDU95538.1 Polyketide cyclase / dehydrase and lipid transport [Microlunatus sagamiharensis]
MAGQTSSSVDIDAGPDAVMAVIADVEDYPAWVDSMRRVTVLTEADGRPEQVEMELAHPLFSDTYVLAYDWRPELVSWHLVRGRLLTAMDGSYALAPKGAGTTVTYTLSVDTTMPMIGLLRRKAEKTIVDGALRGLKRRVEG